MPRLEGYFHYRNLDVSTLKELAARWAPQVRESFKKGNTHLALDDIRESIASCATTATTSSLRSVRTGRQAGRARSRRRRAHSTCSRTSSEGNPRRAFSASSTGMVEGALPSPTARLRNQRRSRRGAAANLGAAEELLLAPEEQFGEFGVVQAVARLEVALPGGGAKRFQGRRSGSRRSRIPG